MQAADEDGSCGGLLGCHSQAVLGNTLPTQWRMHEFAKELFLCTS